MTINIALVTGEALILGCDSVASVSTPLLDPFRLPTEELKDGRLRIEFDGSDLARYVTEAWGGVTKMFQIHDPPACVAATTAGLAQLRNRSMSSLADEFRSKQAARKNPRVNVEAVSNDFLKFIRRQYEKHYANSGLPEEYWDGPEFLAGGFGRDDAHPSLYRIKVKENTVELVYSSGRAGVAWAGQSDAVQRLLFGYDVPLRIAIERGLASALDDQHKALVGAMATNIQLVLDALGAKMPKGLDLKVPQSQSVSLPWDAAELDMGLMNLPLQEAVNLTSFFVNMQSGKARYALGVPTVGGRTHVGFVLKDASLEMPNEPEIAHRSVGFSDDL